MLLKHSTCFVNQVYVKGIKENIPLAKLFFISPCTTVNSFYKTFSPKCVVS